MVRKPTSTTIIVSVAVIVIVAAVAIIAIPLLLGGRLPVSRVDGSGNVENQERNLTDFSSVAVESGFKVEISQATSFKITVTADDNVLSYIQVTKTGSTLTIRLQPGISFHTTVLRAEITMPDIQNVQFSGGVDGTAEGFVLNHDFTVDMSGGSALRIDGRANNLVAVCSGGSSFNLSDFPVTNAQVDFSGGSQGTVNLSGRLDATLSGGSRLFYIGNPMLGTIDTSGGSSISPE